MKETQGNMGDRKQEKKWLFIWKEIKSQSRTSLPEEWTRTAPRDSFPHLHTLFLPAVSQAVFAMPGIFPFLPPPTPISPIWAQSSHSPSSPAWEPQEIPGHSYKICAQTTKRGAPRGCPWMRGTHFGSCLWFWAKPFHALSTSWLLSASQQQGCRDKL